MFRDLQDNLILFYINAFDNLILDTILQVLLIQKKISTSLVLTRRIINKKRIPRMRNEIKF